MAASTALETGLAVNTSVPGDRTTAAGFRAILGALMAQVGAPGVPTEGILYGPGAPLAVTRDPSTMTYHVSAGFVCITQTGQGAYLVGTLIDRDVATDAADGTNPRIDVVYIAQPDNELADSGAARLEVEVGTPSATPAEPSIPAFALKLKSFLVPAGAASTSEATDRNDRPVTTGLAVDWSTVTGKPTTFAPADHDAAKITSGILDLARIPTITAAKMGTDSVGTAQIADGAVGASEIADGSVGTAELASGAVTTAKIAANAVGTAQIAANAVTASQIAADAVGASEIAANAVGTSEIAALAVTAAQIATGTITATQLASNAVSTVKIADNAVTAAKIGSDLLTLPGVSYGTASPGTLAVGALYLQREA